MNIRTLLSSAAVIAVLSACGASSAEEFTPIPAPAPEILASQPQTAATDTIVLAGGCFWGVQGVFQHVKGVTSAVSGYAGGMSHTAEYEKVSVGNTGHAESVQITYDPKQVSLGQLLQIY